MGREMTNKEKNSSSKIKIKRTRKRLYEPSFQDHTATDDTPDPKLQDTQQVKTGSALAEANRIINRFVAYSAGTALVPLPIIDMLVVMAIELKMLKRLSDHYGVPFSEQKGKALIGSLLGGLHAGLFSRSLLKMIPVIGVTGALVPIGVLSGALTFAVGKVFVQHFETGGTLLDFDPLKVQTFFKRKFKEGREATLGVKRTGKAT